MENFYMLKPMLSREVSLFHSWEVDFKARLKTLQQSFFEGVFALCLWLF